MKYEELLHCIRAVAETTGEYELYVFGSQSALMYYGTLPEEAAVSIESDIMTAYNSEANSYVIDGALGESTMFHQTHGIMVDGILVKSITLAPDWEDRVSCFPYEAYNGDTIQVFVPSVNDIAVAKLAAEREKDRAWLQAMYDKNLIDVQEMDSIIWKLDVPFEQAFHHEHMLQRIIDHDERQWQMYT